MWVHGVLLLVPYPREFQVTPLALSGLLFLSSSGWWVLMGAASSPKSGSSLSFSVCTMGREFVYTQQGGVHIKGLLLEV